MEKSKWVAAKLLQVWDISQSWNSQLRVVLLSAQALQKASFLLVHIFNSKSQYIKLTLSLNQESDNLAIHLEGNFLAN